MRILYGGSVTGDTVPPPLPRHDTVELIPLRPTNRPALPKEFLLHIPNGRVPAAGFAPETAIVKCVHLRPIIRFVLDA